MPLHIVKADRADIPQLVDIYFSTFKSALVLKIKPDVPPVREWYEKSLSSDMDKPHTLVYKVEEIDAGSVLQSTGKIIAFAKWSSPHKEDKSEISTKWPEEGDVALFEEVVGKATALRSSIMGDEEHWYLAVLATLPKYQRRGAASLLMTEFCSQADKSGHPSYLEASPLGKSTYERFGFETRDTFSVIIDGEQYIDRCMMRQPQRST